MDKSIEHQQNLPVLQLGVVMLKAKTNRYEDVAPLIANVNEALYTIMVGQIIHISA